MRTLLRAKSRLRRLRSGRACGRSGVAIPLLRGKMYRQLPNKVGVVAIFDGSRYPVPFNRGIATTLKRTGLAMTGNLQHSLSNTNLSGTE